MKINLLNKLESYLIIALIFIYPIFFIPNFSSIFEIPKLILLFSTILLISVFKTIKFFSNKNFEINTSNYDIVVIVLLFTYLVSAIFSISNKVDSFFYTGNTSFVILSAILFFAINQTEKSTKDKFTNTLLASAFVVGIIHIFSSLGVFKLISFLPEIIKVQSFSTSGTVISNAVFLLSVLPILFFKIFKKEDIAEKVLSGLVALVLLISISSSFYTVLKAKDINYGVLNIKHGWSIMIDTLKNYPLVGAGPSNFQHAFDRFKPLTFNNGNDWDIKYLQSSNSFFTIITETGVLGLISLIYLLILIFKHLDFDNPSSMGLLATLLFMAFVPVSHYVLFFLISIHLSLSSKTRSNKYGYFMNSLPNLFISLPLVILMIVSSFYMYKAFYAEILYSTALSKSTNNEIVKAYEIINKAVKVNQYSDRYHLFSANINLIIANGYAKKENLTEEDKNNISQLIQQAISEGKAAVAVSKYKSSNWSTLSLIYQTIIPFAKGSETFAVESLKQSIALDPINPNLRINLGGLFYTYKNYDQAIESFKLAVIAKPNLANAHYNLALAYKESGELEKAKQEMNTTLNLLGKESLNYEKALKELNTISELTQPLEKSEVIIDPQIELPKE